MEWAQNNGGMSIAAWAASAITRGEHMSAPNAEMSQGHLLALARYARLTNDQTQRRLMALGAYWTAATDTGGTASAPP
eukprot:15466360-Alexandrium_andersonii.AAC.1